MNTNIVENLENLKKAVREGYKRDMKPLENELHSEIETELWFLEKSGWSRQEIEIAYLKIFDRETIWQFIEKSEY